MDFTFCEESENMMEKEKKFDLQDRLIDYAVRIIKVTEAFSSSATGKHLRIQMLKSGTSTAANYGEAQGAESRKDIIHKLKVALKELRETEIWLKISFRSSLIQPAGRLKELMAETDELIAILVQCIKTAKKK